MEVCPTEEDSAVHHERRDCDGGPLPERQRVATHGISHDGAIVHQGMCYCLYLRPHGGLLHLSKHLGGNAYCLYHEVCDRFTPTIRRNQINEVRHEILWCRRMAVVDDK